MPYQESKLFTPPIPEVAPGIPKTADQPEDICYTTASILVIRFRENDFPEVVRRYLGTSTMGLIKSSVRGFYAWPDKRSPMPNDALEQFLAEGAVRMDDLSDRDFHAFWHTSAVFQAMPLVYRDIEGLPETHPNKYMFTEPRSPVEFRHRLHELQEQVGRIVYGINGPEALSSGKTEVLRTLAFFGTSKLVQQNANITPGDISVPSIN